MNEDLEQPQFYEPVQLKDRENMVEFSDDELNSTIKSGQEIKDKINKKQDLEDYIEF